MARAIKNIIIRSVTVAVVGVCAAMTPAHAQWGGWGYGWGGYYGGYGGYGTGYGAGGEGCGGINCEGDGWDGGYADMKDAEHGDAAEAQFNKEYLNSGKRGKVCQSKTPEYNDWGDFIGYKPVKIPC